MSYILDALRKSELERRRGMTPDLMTVHTVLAAEKPSLGAIYGAIATTLIGAGIFIGWTHPWQKVAVQVIAPPSHVTANIPPPHASVPVSRPALPDPSAPNRAATPLPPLPIETKTSSAAKTAQLARPAPPARAQTAERTQPIRTVTAVTAQPVHPIHERTAAQPPEKTAPSQEAAPEPTLPTRTISAMAAQAPPVNARTVSPATGKTALPPPEKNPDTGPAGTGQTPKIIALAELPSAIQKELPEISIPIHTYSSSPKERIVGINGHLLQEGDYLAPGLRLEKITPDGVVFSYKNYFFRRGLP